MKSKFIAVMVTLTASFAAHAGGGDWAPSIVCETSDQKMTVAWSYEQLGESLIGREFDIQLPGEDEGLPYLVSTSVTQGSAHVLALQERTGWAEPGEVFPLGDNLSFQLDQKWKTAVLVTADGQKYLLSCE